MAQIIRQSNLFAGEDWRVIYRAFTQINFNAYDFDSIRDSMSEYIRLNYPEDFNDFVQSSEFIAIIDLLAYLGQNLAFRMDLNARENFIDDASRRESILRLARMLGYQPSRNRASTGLVKIVQVRTTENIIDSMGNDLSNTSIVWNDIDNPDWFDQFILIMNSAFIGTNPFGIPVKTGTVDSITTQLYRFNDTNATSGTIPFNTSVNGESINFELANIDFNDTGSFLERTPDNRGSSHISYRTDGNGNSSPNTGFFFLFKQGTLRYTDFDFPTRIDNRLVNIDINNINNDDVFVQSIDDSRNVVDNWTKVPAVVGSNVTFNSIERNIRNIFSVITRENDQISVRFADGRFGSIPIGLFRIWYRVSNDRGNTRLRVRPQDMSNITVTVPYTNISNQSFNLSITFSLQETVDNASPAETIDQIRIRSPEVYYTQDRMVNGEDYNLLPLRSPQALKIKAINRTYSGHSRYIDVNDPTASRRASNIFSDDGILYQEKKGNRRSITLPTSFTTNEIIDQTITPMLREAELLNFFYKFYPDQDPIDPQNIKWINSGSNMFRGTGTFIKTGSGDSNNNIGGPRISDNYLTVGPTSDDAAAKFITEGSLVEFQNAGWVHVSNIIGNEPGFQEDGMGRIRLNKNVLNNDSVQKIIPAFRTTLTVAENAEIHRNIANNISFGLRYDHNTTTWKVIDPINLASSTDDFILSTAGATGSNADKSWLFHITYSGTQWEFLARGFRYVFESENDVRFFFVDRYKSIDQITGESVKDTINILSHNQLPGSTNTASLTEDKIWKIDKNFTYDDSYIEPRRVQVTFYDEDDDGIPDDPYMFENIVLEDTETQDMEISDAEQYIFWEKYTDTNGYENFRPNRNIITVNSASSDFQTDHKEIFFSRKDITFNIHDESFYRYDGMVSNPDDFDDFTKLNQNDYMYRIGRNNLSFHWQHFSPRDQRIDPAITNIIDMFVLDANYDTSIREWIAAGGTLATRPDPPTSASLKISFDSFNSFKMTSDEIIWKPVSYKILFGSQADRELQAKIKIVKTLGSPLDDNQIKSEIINAINDYFNPENWDFGETFYFTELAGYLHSHRNLATSVASVVIVPQNTDSRFGNLFEVKSESNELFISSATVSDVQIIEVNTETNLRITNAN